MRRVWRIGVAMLLVGCATTHPPRNTGLIHPGVTTREEVQAYLGVPHDIVKSPASETPVYVEKERNTLKGGLIGGAMLALWASMIALPAAPFTLGASLLIIPPAALIGGVCGAFIGTVVELDKDKLLVDVGPDGKVVSIKMIPLK